MPHLFYPCNVVHCQFLQRALEFLIVSCCRLVNNLFLSAGCSLKNEQVWMPKKDKMTECTNTTQFNTTGSDCLNQHETHRLDYMLLFTHS